MKFKDNMPIYLQIIDHVKLKIATGEYKRAEKLESVRDMAQKLRVNHNTIAKTYQFLEKDGVIFSKKGVGSFITESEEMISRIREERIFFKISTFVNDLRVLGYSDKKMIEELEKFLKGEIQNG